MNCPSCGNLNPPDSAYCESCGEKLVLDCNSCGADLGPGAKFCRKCGTPAGSDASSIKPTASPNREPREYTPSHLSDKILRSKSALEGERKRVTVMFADVKGSMNLARQLDPEVWHTLLDRFFAILTEGVHRFEGTVNQYTGDGIMALFGAPIAHEDHAQRACYAALRILEAIDAYETEVKRVHGIGFSARMGLNTGEVVVGAIGDDLRMDYTAQGHTVGLAQRMEALAQPNSCYLTDATAALASGYFALDDLGEFRVKGVVGPVRIHRLAGIGKSQRRFDISRARGFSRFVGRASDLRTLEDAVEQAIAGNGQVVGVVAEAGTGKSRLCFEFLERCRARGMNVFEGHAVAHGRNIPFLPVLEVIRAYFGIEPQDDDRTAREKIAGRIVVLDQSLAGALPTLYDFLGVSDQGLDSSPLGSDARLRQIAGILRQVERSASETQPFVTLIEDLHWLDAASEEFLSYMVDSRGDSRSLLLLNFRPEFHAEWMQKSWYRQLPLTSLGREDVAELLVDLVGTHSSLAGLTDLVHSRTGGNPFFAEEVVQSLIESGHLQGDRGAYKLIEPIERLDVPATVQAVLAARIDRLPDREKRLLQTASVIGKDFAEPLLAAVAEVPNDELKEGLEALRRNEFIHEDTIYPVVHYSFKHPLTQEVALGTLLREKRRPLHASIAEQLEAEGGNLDERAALLAHHWDHAECAQPAAQWHRRAAEWIGGSNSAEATRHWERVRALVDAIDDPELATELGDRSCQMLIELGWRLGLSEEEADKLIQEGETWARKRNDPRALSSLYSGASMLVAIPLGQLARGQTYAEEALRLAEAADDAPLIFMNQVRVCLINEYLGNLPAARAAIEAATAHEVSVMEEASSMLAYDASAYAPGARAIIAQEQGRLEESLKWLEISLTRARERQATEVLQWLLGFGTETWLDKGDYERAASSAREALGLSEVLGDMASATIAEWAMCRANLKLGNLDTAIHFAERWIESSERSAKMWHAMALSTLSELRLMTEECGEALRLASEALTFAEASGFQLGKVWSELAHARIHLNEGTPQRLEEAASWLARADQSIQDTGFFARLPDLLELRAELNRQRDDTTGYRAALQEALCVYEEKGATPHAERIKLELAS